MKIGMYVPVRGFRGGIERHAHDLSLALRADGHRTVLLFSRDGGRDADRFGTAFDDVRQLDRKAVASDLDVAYALKVSKLDELAALGSMPIAFGAHDHDDTCVRSHRYVPAGRVPCHRAPGASCVTHGCVVVRTHDPDTLVPLRIANPFALRRRLLAHAARGPLIACSRYIAERLIDAGAPRARVHAIHPVTPAATSPLVPRPQRPHLVAAGQMVHGKGLDLAIDALARLPDDVTLEIVGDGAQRDVLEARARLVAPERVHFRGYVSPDAMDGVYDAASVVLVPSRWPEPFGLVGIEAMRRGRPVVGAAHGGIPEWLADGRVGALFEPGDAGALAKAIERVLAMPNAGIAAATHARLDFDGSRSVGALERLFESMSARRAA